METFKDLKAQFELHLFTNGKYNCKKWKSKPELKRLIDQSAIGNMKNFKEKVYALISGTTNRPTCKTCGSQNIKLITTSEGFTKNCSRKCSAANQETLDARKNTCISKYGVENIFQDTKTKIKIKETIKERYGVESIVDSLAVKDEIKQTLLERYGVDNPAKSEIIREKIKNTCKERYHTEWAASAEVVKEKTKLTCLQRYGKESWMASGVGQKSLVQGMTSKYGVAHNMMHKETVDKSNKTKRIDYIANILPTRIKQLEELNIQLDGWNISDYSDQSAKYDFYHITCATHFKSKFKDGKVPCCPKCKHSRSKIEQKLFETLKSLKLNAIANDRSKIAPQEIDILIDNLGIEVNGAYWHSDTFEQLGGRTLLSKTDKFQSASGGKLLHFWDSELLLKFDLCIDIIKDHLTNSPIDIETEIKSIDKSTAEEFNDKYSLSQFNSDEFFGVFYGDELFAVANCDIFNDKIMLNCLTSKHPIENVYIKIYDFLFDAYNKEVFVVKDNRFSKGTPTGFVLLKTTLPQFSYINNILVKDCGRSIYARKLK